MKLITKLRRGLPLVPTIIAKLDEIVDYLLATRLIQGPGVQLSEDADGVVISVTGLSRSKKNDDYALVTAGPGVCISGTSETPAVSGSTNSTVPLAGSTISMLLEPGTPNVMITDGQNGSKVISVTGNTSGDGSDIPPYSALSFGGGAPEYGLGHTFIMKVKKGNIGFWDEGGGAVGKWTNKAGTSSYTLTNKTAYNAPEDGWMRITVIDDGSAPGECLSFFSPTGGIPLYKYGTFGSTASGICYPDYKELGTVTGAPAADVRGTGTTYLLPVYSGISVRWYSSGNNVFARYAPGVGVTVSGATASDIAKDTNFPVLANGWVRISVIDEGTIENSCLRFYVNNNDVTSFISLYRYNRFQRLRGDGTTIRVNGDVISYIGGSTSGGGGESSLNFVTSVGIVVLTGSSKQLVYCPQATDSEGYKYNQYGFSLPGTATIDALNAATGKSLVNTGQFDDEGNIIFVLPENPTALTSVDIRLTYGSTETIVCTVDGKKIVDASGGQQGVSNGVCDDGMDGGNHYMYVYITSISGYPEYYDAYGNEAYIAQYIESDGGCWVRLDIDN